MITVTIDENVFAARLAEQLAKADAISLRATLNRVELTNQTFEDKVEVRGDLTEYRVDHLGDQPSPFSTPFGPVRTVRMAGSVGVIQMENGDYMVYDGGLIFNHSLYIRITLAEINKALKNLG